ncbi:DNAse i-like superfamily protein [Anaeramoeba ignava]|uniref:DNAse i-like superfamily protein n=1 Tax=Anaeramoeba ignava TaxID=1746090 RepID=A0A9Q0LFA3_ANAIG|nr:DNAse i-like superfamily protein [Anaeramoeba ignava]
MNTNQKETEKEKEKEKEKETKSITIFWNYPSEKKDVKIAGNFNNWNPNEKMDEKNGKYEKTIEFLEGEQQFKFIIDGEWKCSPDYEQTENEPRNNVIFIEKKIKTKLRIMSFNIRYDNPDDGKFKWENRKKFVIELIKIYKPSVISLQEALKNQIVDLEKDLKHFSWIGGGRNDGKDSGEFAAIFYNNKKLDCLNQSTFWLSKTPDKIGSISWGSACVRICTWGLFAKKSNHDMKFYVFNTHLDHISENSQINSAKLIRSKISQITKNRFGYVLTGDFNITPDSNVYKEFFKDESEKDHHNFADLVDSSLVADFKNFEQLGSFTGWKTSKIVENSQNILIDYIFCNPSAKVKSYNVIIDTFGNFRPSDHRPIMVRLLL